MWGSWPYSTEYWQNYAFATHWEALLRYPKLLCHFWLSPPSLGVCLVSAQMSEASAAVEVLSLGDEFQKHSSGSETVPVCTPHQSEIRPCDLTFLARGWAEAVWLLVHLFVEVVRGCKRPAFVYFKNLSYATIIFHKCFSFCSGLSHVQRWTS